MSKISVLIKAGQRTGQVATGKTISLSSDAESDLLITIQKYDKDQHCQSSQLKLAWMWAADRANHERERGDAIKGKDDFYLDFKVRYLAPRLAEDDGEFAALWDRVKGIYREDGKDMFYQFADKAISHNDCTVKQVSDALKNLEQYMQDAGIQYRSPEDYKFAMQIESYEGAK